MLTIQIFKKWQPLVSQGNFYRQPFAVHATGPLWYHLSCFSNNVWSSVQTSCKCDCKTNFDVTGLFSRNECYAGVEHNSTVANYALRICDVKIFVSHSQEVWTRFYEPQENYVNIQLDFLHVCIKIASYDAGLRITFLWKKKSTPSKLRLLISLIKTTEVELIQFLKSDGTHLDYKCAGMECNTTVPCFWQ